MKMNDVVQQIPDKDAEDSLVHEVDLQLSNAVRLRMIIDGEYHRWVFHHSLRVPGDEQHSVGLVCKSSLLVDYKGGRIQDQIVLSMHVILPNRAGQEFFAGVDISPGYKTYLEWTYKQAGEDRFALQELCVGVCRRFSFAEEPGLVKRMSLPFPVPLEIVAEGRNYDVPFRVDATGTLDSLQFHVLHAEESKVKCLLDNGFSMSGNLRTTVVVAPTREGMVLTAWRGVDIAERVLAAGARCVKQRFRRWIRDALKRGVRRGIAETVGVLLFLSATSCTTCTTRPVPRHYDALPSRVARWR